MQHINELMPLSNDWNKERLDTLKKLFPDLFTNEGKINIDEIKKIADPENVLETERYEFRWFGKSQAKRNAFTPSNATLVFDENRSINAEKTQNIIIEGENLEVLKLLSGAYREKVKCIYIDPPYNTGKDFVYSDNFTQDRKAYWEEAGVIENGIKIDTNTETDGRYHSNWLNMMYSRLLIARQLLREDGVMFISIDDNEVHHLRKLCDEVFGEENFVGIFCWKNKYGAGAKTKGFIEVHEYIICYSKEIVENIEAKLTDEQIKEFDKRKDGKYNTRGGYITQPLMTKSMDDRENLKYSIKYENDIIIPRKQWVWEEARLMKAIKNDEIIFKKKKNGEYSVRSKVYLKDENGNIRKGKPITVLNGPFNQDGTEEVETQIGEGIFSFPKPKALLKYLLSFTINGNESKNDLILDFFGGSGTTAQAVTELNKEDGGTRQYILVQLPEATDEKSEAHRAGYRKISDITIARNQRVLAQIDNEKVEKTQQIELLTQQIAALENDIATERKGAPQLALEGAGESKAIQKKRNEIEAKNKQIIDLEVLINKTNNLDKGFKVFQLQKSNFPRVEFLPDADKSDEENIALLRKYIDEKEQQMINLFSKNDIVTEILLKQHFDLNYALVESLTFQGELENKTVTTQTIERYSDGKREAWLCLESKLLNEIVAHFKVNTSQRFICLERALDSNKKYNLKHYMGDNFVAF